MRRQVEYETNSRAVLISLSSSFIIASERGVSIALIDVGDTRF